MTERRVSEQEIHAWLDGEADEYSVLVQQALQDDVDAALEAESVRITGEFLRNVVAEGVPETEPLMALQKIRQKIEAQEQKRADSWLERIRGWFTEPLRRPVLGVACAMVLGVLAAPVFMWLGGSGQGPDLAEHGAQLAVQDVQPLDTQSGVQEKAAGPVEQASASVRIESLEIEGSARSRVFHPGGSTTTAVIWLDYDEGFNEEGF